MFHNPYSWHKTLLSTLNEYQNKSEYVFRETTDQVVLWVRFPVGAGSSHTKDFKNVSGPCLHGTQDEVGTTKHIWLAQCQYNVTWLACGPMICYPSEAVSSQGGQWVPLLQIGTSSHLYHCPCRIKQLAKSMTLQESGKTSLMSWLDVKLIRQTNKQSWRNQHYRPFKYYSPLLTTDSSII